MQGQGINMSPQQQGKMNEIRTILGIVDKRNRATKGIIGQHLLLIHDFEDVLVSRYHVPLSRLPAFQFNPKARTVQLLPHQWLELTSMMLAFE